MAEIQKGACPDPGCSRTDVSITATGGLRNHAANGKRVSADNPACPGSGQDPAGARGLPETATGYVCRIPAGPDGCGRPVILTSNRRARSHLNNAGHPCAGGSDWPLRVDPQGNRHDTASESEVLQGAGPEGLRFETRSAGEFDPRDPGTVLDDMTDEARREAYGDDVGVLTEHLAGTPVSCPPHDYGGHDTWDEQNGTETSIEACLRCGEIAPGETDPALFDPTHVLTTDLGTEVHPGEAADCVLPGCCTHPQGFTYIDDDNGHSGSFCRVCGTEEPELVRDPEPTPEPSPMESLGDLTEGILFTRHTLRHPMDRLVYRVQAVTEFCVQVIVVSSGAHSGRTGELTNLQEEITCTDLNGTPRPRRTPVGPPTGPDLYPTPSAPARPTPTRAPTSTPPTTAPAKQPPALKADTSGRVTSSGPSATRSTPTPTAPRKSAVTDVFSTAGQAVKESDKYDSYGRYKLLHPKTGKAVKWTRATTYAKSIQDTFALSQWAQRMTLKGASLRPDIVAAVSTLEVKADKDRVNGLVDDAKKAAGDKVAANKGTAVHAFTEDRDRVLVGLPVKDREVPEEFVATVDAYTEVLRAFGLEPVPGLIEFTTAVLQYEVAGTSDRVYRVTRDITLKLNGRPVTLYAGEYVIGDVKTGADLSYGWQEIAIQLALYAQGLNTSGVWDWGTRQWSRPVSPDDPTVQIQVRTDVGIIPHLPVDRSTTKAPLATLYAVDLSAGWAAAVLCGQVRSWRKERTLATPLEIADVAVDPGPDRVHPEPGDEPRTPVSRTVASSRPVTLQDKARAVTSRAEASAVFQEAKGARVSVDELNRLTAIMQDKLKSFVEQGA